MLMIVNNFRKTCNNIRQCIKFSAVIKNVEELLKTHRKNSFGSVKNIPELSEILPTGPKRSGFLQILPELLPILRSFVKASGIVANSPEPFKLVRSCQKKY